MAKRKKRKESPKSFSYSIELTGLVLILIGIIGTGFGPIGNFIKGFSMFLAGDLWYIVLFALIYIGAYMLFKRKLPKFFSQKLIGLYLLFAVILILSHFDFLKETLSWKEMLKVTYDHFNARLNTLTPGADILSTGDSTIVIGGGIIGSLLLGLLSSAFGQAGVIVVVIIVTIFSLILLFNINLADLFAKIFKKRDKTKSSEDEDEKVPRKEYILNGDELVGVKPVEEETPKDNKIVISSIDELKNINNENQVKEETHESFEIEKVSTETEYNFKSSEYKLPKFDLLTPTSKKQNSNEEAFVRSNQEILERVLSDFDIKGKVCEIHIGPAVTEYEVTVPAGTKLSKIVNINKEIALAMAAKDVRIQAPIPGKSTIGIEIPNREIAAVNIREVLESTAKEKGENKILVVLGKDIMGKSIITDLTKTPHLLVAGSTGSGKSVCINCIIASILMRYKPDEVKLVLVDPKKVELSNYNGTPHLYWPVVTDPRKANVALQKMVSEMERRYNEFERTGVKNIAGYNAWIEKENSKSMENEYQKMPYFVVIIDELADLMMVASKEVQDSIMRITQMARAAGIHLIVATQRPSTDIITGVIKNNIPSRIAFAVSSSIDSRTILDQAGAEKLLGKGDMLFAPMGQNVPTRIQGCFVSDEEINKLINYCQTQGQAKYNEDLNNVNVSSGSSNEEDYGNGGAGDEPMYDEIVEFAIKTGKISASLVQRRFRFGYNRAARVIDMLEERGIVGPANGSKPREVLVKMDNQNEEE